MNIAVAGLGLIGGSISKALKENTKHKVYGIEINNAVSSLALKSGAVESIIGAENLKDTDVCFVCMFPKTVVSFILQNIDNFKKGSIIVDVCGVKKYIADKVELPLLKKGIFYIGGHPMAGKENSGFANSDSKMLKDASFILTKTASTDKNAFEKISDLIKSIGCNIIITTPDIHDKIIAYTSQLAHIVSSSYVKSPSIELERGFTGGSFQDMTRVAILSEEMWKDLFILNKDNLLSEIDILIKNLNDYKNALNNSDEAALKELLKEGRDIKKRHLK